ncbi:unnamed protein product [Caenorhabditis auriculariae]|uniref:CCDC92/74 N-terminal domain-containing protein n=1 Tax=Caenorhabditis auriculariae TaxID=2777116 RepID=A0A8S1H5D3_9PELO|nr:unnamed protein product [Caenorhabditis auriculariae]
MDVSAHSSSLDDPLFLTHYFHFSLTSPLERRESRSGGHATRHAPPPKRSVLLFPPVGQNPMTTAVAVARRHQAAAVQTSFFEKEALAATCSGTTSHIQDEQAEELEAKVRDALRERDEQWRRHEKAQITFLQNETAAMLKSLHVEIDRLSSELRYAKRQLFIGENESGEGVEEAAKKIEKLEKQLLEKEAYTRNIEKKVTATIEKLQEQIGIQNDRIRQLSDELNDRNQTVAHLSGQLRQIRLREAMATAQQRRRASQSSTSPLTSPCSPHRIFAPGTGLVSSSVSVTYPHEIFTRTREVGGSIEKPSQRRSFSAARAPQLPR